MNGRQVHRTSTFLMSLAMLVIGLALVIQVIAGDGGAISARLLLGILFLAAGAGRMYVEVRRGGRA